MIIENVKLTSDGVYEDFNLNEYCFSKKDKEELKKAIVNNKLTEDLSILREVVIPIIGDYGLELIITKNGFEFSNGDY